jgi:hypothetical protein
MAFGSGNDLGERLHFPDDPETIPSDIATQIMAAMVRRPPKPHEDMKPGKSKASPRLFTATRARKAMHGIARYSVRVLGGADIVRRKHFGYEYEDANDVSGLISAGPAFQAHSTIFT